MSYFATLIEDPEWGNYYSLTTAGYTTIIVLVLLLWLGACFISGIKRDKSGGAGMPVKHLVFSAAAIALATVTSFLKIYKLPMGGSVTLFSMLFICLIGYWYGLRSGLMAAVAYGFLQLIIDPYIISIPQMITDYLLAFGALGLSGFFKNRKNGLFLGYIMGVLGRYFFAFLSGLIFFGSYAADYGMTAPVYSLVYNGSYLGLEAALTLALLSVPTVNKGLLSIKRMALSD